MVLQDDPGSPDCKFVKIDATISQCTNLPK